MGPCAGPVANGGERPLRVDLGRSLAVGTVSTWRLPSGTRRSPHYRGRSNGAGAASARRCSRTGSALVEIIGLGQRAVQIFRIRRRPAETLVVVFDKLRHPCVFLLCPPMRIRGGCVTSGPRARLARRRLDSVYAARPATRPRSRRSLKIIGRTPIGERAGIAGITACYCSDLPFSPGAFRSNALILLPIWMTLLVPGSTVNRALRAPLTGCLRAPLTGSVGAGSPSRV